MNDAISAYTHALLWAANRDSRHAEKAIEVMDAWSGILKKHNNSNAPLQAGWAASVWARAAEIVRFSPKIPVPLSVKC